MVNCITAFAFNPDERTQMLPWSVCPEAQGIAHVPFVVHVGVPPL
jgi:hypothetical protein